MDGNLIGKVLRFSVTGLLGAAIDFGVTYLFKEILKVNKFVSNAIGFTLAATLCFFLNKYWTYESQSPLAWSEYFTFIAVSLVGLGINTLVLYLLTEKLGWHFYLSKCFAIGVAAVWNFLANLLITFA
jgi:putative flippase GtrA